MKYTTHAIAALVLALVPIAPADAKEVSIASGRNGGVYYPVAGGVCTLVNELWADHGITCTVEFGTGSVSNIQALRDGEVELAMAQSDTQRDALVGTGPFGDRGPYEDLRALASLFVEQLTIVSRRDKAIARLADLKGQRVYLGPPGSGGRVLIDRLLEKLDIAPDDLIEVPEGGYAATDIAEALCDDQVDAFIITVGHPSPLVREASAQCAIELVPVSGPAADALLEAEPLYARSVIPAHLYDDIGEDVAGIGLVATLVTTADLDPGIAYTFAKAFIEGNDRLRAASPLFASLTIEQMASDGLVAPIHEGALRYYEEVGLR